MASFVCHAWHNLLFVSVDQNTRNTTFLDNPKIHKHLWHIKLIHTDIKKNAIEAINRSYTTTRLQTTPWLYPSCICM